MADQWIVDVDARTFQTQVLERSTQVPVVVDFWATWCGPCKELGPLLERLATEGKGSFLLAKVDVDANPELAQAFRVQAIPTVVGLRDGRIVDGFQGALPEPELRAFLERLAPGAGAGGGVVAEARERAASGDLDGAITSLRQRLREVHDDDEARLALVDLLLDAGRAIEARKVFDRLPEAVRAEEAAKAVETKLRYAESAEDLEPLRAAAEASPDSPEARIAYGKALVAAQRYREALDELLAAYELDPRHDGGAARKAMIEVFDILGPEDPVANEYRYKLSLLLFS